MITRHVINNQTSKCAYCFVTREWIELHRSRYCGDPGNATPNELFELLMTPQDKAMIGCGIPIHLIRSKFFKTFIPGREI